MYKIDQRFKKQDFTIKILGSIDEGIESYFKNMEISKNGQNTVLTGNFKDYDSLITVLTALKLLNQTLISVQQTNY